MDVGYIEKNEDDVEIVVMRRNITVGLGCGCLEKRIRRYQQTGNIEDKWASDKKSPNMSETGGEDLPDKVEGVEEGKAGDEKPQICEIGHKERQELEALLKLPRILVILKDYRMKLALGAGKVKKTSMKELVVEFKASEEGQLLINGGSLSFPLSDHVKDKTDEARFSQLPQNLQNLLSQELKNPEN